MHIGNGVNFLLTYILVKFYHGKLHLKIDDIDTSHIRDKYIENIFYTLEHLGIECDSGASCVDEYKRVFSYKHRAKNYKCEIDKIRFCNDIYACSCSRKVLSKSSFSCTCYEKNLPYDPNLHNLRLRIDANSSLKAKKDSIVLWRKGDEPSYNFASIHDDKNMKISLIVRGEDLMQPTLYQKYISKRFYGGFLEDVRFIHHKLIYDKYHKKLSKSSNSPSILLSGAKKEIYTIVGEMLHLPKSANESIKSLTDSAINHPKNVENFIKNHQLL